MLISEFFLFLYLYFTIFLLLFFIPLSIFTLSLFAGYLLLFFCFLETNEDFQIWNRTTYSVVSGRIRSLALLNQWSRKIFGFCVCGEGLHSDNSMKRRSRFCALSIYFIYFEGEAAPLPVWFLCHCQHLSYMRTPCTFFFFHLIFKPSQSWD